MVCNGLKGLNSRVAVQAEQWGATTVQLGKPSVWICGAMRVFVGC